MSCTSALLSSRCGSDIELNEDKHGYSAKSCPEQPFTTSFIYDGHDRSNRHASSVFNPSATLSSLLEAQAPPLSPEMSTDENPTSDDAPLIYGFPAHWFGVTSTAANPVNTSNPIITISAPESYSPVETISSPKPTPFGIDLSWMSCSGPSTGHTLRHSTTSSWLNDDDDFFPRLIREVKTGGSRIVWKGIGREVNADCLRVGF